MGFSNVGRRSGYVETITIYFEGEEPQIMGSVDAIGRRNDFHAYDGELRRPGSKVSLDVGKQVEFYEVKGRKDVARYSIRHESAASRPGASGPGGDPRGPARPSISVDCKREHDLTLEVVPPSPPPCRRRGQPCPS